MRVPYRDIITIEPGKRGGKPCIRGMRITVYDVLSYLAAGSTIEEVLADFPYLTEEDVRACLSYAADRERQMLVAHACAALDLQPAALSAPGAQAVGPLPRREPCFPFAQPAPATRPTARALHEKLPPRRAVG